METGVHNLHSIVLIQVLFHTKTNNSNLYLDQLVVKKLNDLIIYSHSREVWNPEYSVPTIQFKQEKELYVKWCSDEKSTFFSYWISKGVMDVDQEMVRSIVD